MELKKVNPRIEIHTDKLTHNAKQISKMTQEYGITPAAVTKGFCAIPQVAAAIVAGDIGILADSRIENLKKLRTLNARTMLLRLPMISQAETVVKYANISLNSEIKTLKALNEAANIQGRTHQVILMIDLGDLREGIMDDFELMAMIRQIKQLKNISLVGLGTNLTCFGAVIPDEKNLGRLIDLAQKIEKDTGQSLEFVSGGNSSSVYLMMEKRMPKGITNLRIGESILMGTESAYGKKIPDMYYDAFQLVAEIVEIREKPTVPIGQIGMDAFGGKPTFEDRGMRKRAIVAVGKQDFATHPVKCIEPGVDILGSSSDHMILDITDAEKKYFIGSELKFTLSYGAMLALTTSPYISTQLVNGGLGQEERKQ